MIGDTIKEENLMEHATLINILKDQVKPALGCTEPIAVAYATAKAKEVLENKIEELEIKVDRNIFKNAMGVFIPGTNKKGLKIAAALAIVCGNSDYKLEVLKNVSDLDVAKALNIIDNGKIHVSINKDSKELYIEIIARNHQDCARVLIKGKHDNIILIKKNKEIIYQKECTDEITFDVREAIKKYRIKDFINFANTVDLNKIDIIHKGIMMNKNLSDCRLNESSGVKFYQQPENIEGNFKEYAKILTFAACEARMLGYPFPVMSCAGSGNHGLNAILPIVAVGEAKKIDYEEVQRGVVLSLLLTIYVKSFTGVLSPMCGCGVAAGLGASAGIVYVLKGNSTQIEGTINNMVGGLAGMLCDGGKPGCAFKLLISVNTAIEAAMMALSNIFLSPDDGIVDKTAEDSIKNLGNVCTNGMDNTDEVILEVMMEKN